MVGKAIYKKSFKETIVDGRLTKEDNEFLDKLQNTLRLPEALANKISEETRSNFMQAYIAKIIADQRLSPDEEQRRIVSRELHDDILQNLFFVQIQLADAKLDSALHLQKTIVRLRQTIKAQRPSLLDQGIVLALQDLISDLNQLTNDKTIIQLRNLLSGPIVLDDEKTTALYHQSQVKEKE